MNDNFMFMSFLLFHFDINLMREQLIGWHEDDMGWNGKRYEPIIYHSFVFFSATSEVMQSTDVI